MAETRVQDGIGEQLQAAALRAAMPGEDDAEGEPKKAARSRKVSPLNGQPLPAGRPKGVPNKTTATIRDAVMQAFHHVGGWTYLVKLAEGTQSDRAAFTSLLNKVLPTQINANVDGGIKLELSWLGQRQIGAVVAQEPERITQVVDLERDAKGKYRIADQEHANIAEGGKPQEPAGGDESEGR